MKKLIILMVVLVFSIEMRAQAPEKVPAFACFGGVVFLDSSGAAVVYHLRSNVFPISHFMGNFKATADDWLQLENMTVAEANKQLAAMGFKATVHFPVLLSNYDDQVETQAALNEWNSRIRPDITIEIPSPAISAFSNLGP